MGWAIDGGGPWWKENSVTSDLASSQPVALQSDSFMNGGMPVCWAASRKGIIFRKISGWKTWRKPFTRLLRNTLMANFFQCKVWLDGNRDCQASKGFDKYVTVDDADVYWCQETICKSPGPRRRHSRISADMWRHVTKLLCSARLPVAHGEIHGCPKN